MHRQMARTQIALAMLLCLEASSVALAGEKKYDPGASDTEIKIGNIMPYSGPASAWGDLGKAEAAYFNKINAEGGINGRKINFISYDDSYSPPKTVQQARRLVEGDEVLLIFGPFGVPTNSAIHKYMNSKKVPQLFIAGGGSKWNDPQNFPWTMGFQPSFVSEGKLYGKYAVDNFPTGKIAVLSQNDDYGRDMVKGLKLGLGANTSMIVVEETYEVSEPTIASRIARMKSSGADIFMNFSGPKFAAQAIQSLAQLNWKPIHIVNVAAASIGSVMKPAGLDISQGIISGSYVKDATDPTLANDPGLKTYLEFIHKYNPGADISASTNTQGYLYAQLLVHVLKQAGDNLTRENIMKEAANIKNLELDMLLPGITINTSPNDFAPIETMQLRRLTRDYWQPFGSIVEVGQ